MTPTTSISMLIIAILLVTFIFIVIVLVQIKTKKHSTHPPTTFFPPSTTHRVGTMTPPPSTTHRVGTMTPPSSTTHHVDTMTPRPPHPENQRDGADFYRYKPNKSSIASCQRYVGSPVQCPGVLNYDQRRTENTLWENPALNDINDTWSNFTKNKDVGVVADKADVNGSCPNAYSQGKCCLPAPGCYPKKTFNWILSTCIGKNCGDFDQFQKSCLNDLDRCPSDIVRKQVLARDEGSELVVNYVAAYQFNPQNKNWEKNLESSFNTFGQYPSYDLSKPGGGLKPNQAWMPGPQPGGAAFWGYGWYPAGVKGPGPPGMLFVLSTNKCKNMAWFVLNQATLDRGPAVLYDTNKSNTWACANSGEWDLLESSWSKPGFQDTSDYLNLYTTMSNQGNWGRALFNSFGGPDRTGLGGFDTGCYIRGSASQPQIFVAVIDQVGTFVYSLPIEKADQIWPGISGKTCSNILPARPTIDPVAAPCTDMSRFCCVFTPFSQAKNINQLRMFTDDPPEDRGFCGNFYQDNFVNTGQKWGSTQEILGGVEMPWTTEMLCNTASGPS